MLYSSFTASSTSALIMFASVLHVFRLSTDTYNIIMTAQLHVITIMIVTDYHNDRLISTISQLYVRLVVRLSTITYLLHFAVMVILLAMSILFRLVLFFSQLWVHAWFPDKKLCVFACLSTPS